MLRIMDSVLSKMSNWDPEVYVVHLFDGVDCVLYPHQFGNWFLKAERSMYSVTCMGVRV